VSGGKLQDKVVVLHNPADHNWLSCFPVSADKFDLARPLDLVDHLRESSTYRFRQTTFPGSGVHVFVVEVDADGVKARHFVISV
jgi:hypothetical protein